MAFEQQVVPGGVHSGEQFGLLHIHWDEKIDDAFDLFTLGWLNQASRVQKLIIVGHGYELIATARLSREAKMLPPPPAYAESRWGRRRP